MNKQNSPEQPLKLDPNPSAKEESDAFSSPDERADTRNKNHELELLRQQQGPIGRLIGCSDSALTIAFVLLGIGAVVILAAAVGMIWFPAEFGSILEKMITFELTIAGYVMGKKSD